MDREKVLDLAKLARIEIGDKEAESLSNELNTILGYVGEVKKVTNDQRPTTDNNTVKNVMREDAEPHQSGLYTEKILEQAPAREDDYIKVKKIL